MTRHIREADHHGFLSEQLLPALGVGARSTARARNFVVFIFQRYVNLFEPFGVAVRALYRAVFRNSHLLRCPARSFLALFESPVGLYQFVSVDRVLAPVRIKGLIESERQTRTLYAREESFSPEGDAARELLIAFERRPVRQFKRALDERRHVRRVTPHLRTLEVDAQARPLHRR